MALKITSLLVLGWKWKLGDRRPLRGTAVGGTGTCSGAGGGVYAVNGASLCFSRKQGGAVEILQ